MGKAKGKKGRRQQDSSDDDDFVDPIQAALAAGGGDDAAVAAPVAFIGRDTARTAVASFVSAASAALYSAFVRLNAFR